MAESPLDKSKRLLKHRKKMKETEEGERLLKILPQGEDSGLDADTVDGKHAHELGGAVAVGSSSGSGTSVHGNEMHNPNMAEETHTI